MKMIPRAHTQISAVPALNCGASFWVLTRAARNTWRLPKTTFLSVLGLVACFACRASADPFDVLSQRFSGVQQELRSTTFGNNTYVAVGDGGTILTSTDTVTWIPRLSGTTNRLNGVRYGANGFIAVGESAAGTPATILLSVDGVSWSPRVCPVTNSLAGISYWSGVYVAVGSTGTIVSSTNGLAWTASHTGAPYDLLGTDAGYISSSAYVGNLFLAVGDSGLILTSPDGLAWTVRFSGTFNRLTAVSMCSAYTGLIVAVGESGTVLTSPDGQIWTVQTSGTTSHLYAVAKDNQGRFGAVGQGGVFMTAMNGVGWIPQQSGVSNDLNGLLYVNGNFLVVGAGGAIQAGIAWLTGDSGTMATLQGVTFGQGQFLAVGGDSTSVILSSVDGANWHTQFTGTNGPLNAATYGNNGFVVVGDQGLVLVSTNGSDWTSQSLSPTMRLLSVAYSNGRYVALGYSPGPFLGGAAVVYESPDGQGWSGPVSLPIWVAAPNIHAQIAFGTNMFVAVGGSGPILSSPDGLLWAAQNPADASSITYGNGLFAAVCDDQILTSPDGTNWTSNSFPVSRDPITFGDRVFVAMGAQETTFGNVYVTSVDGMTWVTRGIEGDIDGPQTSCIAFGNGRYVAVGDAGTIRASTLTNALAAPLISGSVDSRGFGISVLAQPGYSYRILSTKNPASGNWSDLFDFAGALTALSFVDTSATNSGTGYYKVIRLP